MSTKDGSDFEVRSARKQDMVAVASLIQELADFEQMSNGPKLTVKDLERDGFETSPPLFRCAVASRNDGCLAGYALYFPIYSSWRGAAAQLEDLYVTPTMRGKGLGGKLFDYVSKEVSSNGGSRLDFHVLNWNPARKFYEKRGAQDLTVSEKWHYYRINYDSELCPGRDTQ